MPVEEGQTGPQSLLSLVSGRLHVARLKDVWPRLLTLGAVSSAAALAAAKILLPRTQGLSVVLPDVLGSLSAIVGFGALVYYVVAFALNRKLRDVFLCAGFAAVAAAGVLLVVAAPFDSSGLPNDRLFLVAWLYAGALAAGAPYSRSIVRFNSRWRSGLGYLVAAAGVVAFPVVSALCSGIPEVADRLRKFPNEFWAPQMDSWIAFAAALLHALAAVGAWRSSAGASDRSDRVLAVFYAVMAAGLVCRASASSSADVLWLAGLTTMCTGWVVIAGAFMAFSAVVNSELLDSLGELEALHEVSWSLVGARDSDQFLHTLAETLRSKLRADIVALYLGDYTGEYLTLAARSGGGDKYAVVGSKYAVVSKDRWPGFHSGHTADAFRTGEVRTADDVFIDVEFVPWRTIARTDGRAVSLPLIEQGSTIGVLNLYYPHFSQVSSQSMSLLQTIAASLGPAIGGVWRQRCDGQQAEIREAA